MRTRPAISSLALIAAVVALSSVSLRAEPGLSIKVVPPKAELLGPDAVQQVVVDVPGPKGIIDKTGSASFVSADTRVAEVDSTGLIVAKGDGSTFVTVTVDKTEAKVPVTVRGFAQAQAMNFANQVVPVFTKLGCNSGGCHGKASGQNGFRLSLLGFEPTIDYETLVKEGRGRRLFPAFPDRSLLLDKATARTPHGGGKKMEPGSHEYQVIRRWVALGMPVGEANDPTVDRVAIYPEARVVALGSKQQVVVTAYYTDGRAEDVTRWAQYQSNDLDVADVAEGGLVRSLTLSGQAAIMARYQGRVAVFRATVPVNRPALATKFEPVNVVDKMAAKQWSALGIAPSDTCTDAEFIRRASLDVIGTLPTATETKAFVGDKAIDKRAKLVDALLERPEYSAFFAIKWADILRNKRDGQADGAFSTYRFHDWIKESLARNIPYDRFVRAILTATGTAETAPAVTWYRKKRKTDEFVDDTAQVFLGMRLQCAKCHHHPFEVWGQDDYYGFAAFFGRIGRKPSLDGKRDGRQEEVIFTSRSGSVSHPKTGKVMPPKGLGDKVVPLGVADDPRGRLADWMASPSNPYFARAFVNRYWAHFFGRGIVEPLDDMRLTNPPSNAELLDGIADSFVKSGYDVKGLVRLLTTSRVYGLSSVPNESNAKDRQSFARRYPRRMGAEVLLDAISQLSGSPTAFGGLPVGTRAIDLPDEGIASGFLDAFGRPKRDTACECERVGDASLGQSLMLLNSGEIQAKLTAAGGRAEKLAADTRPDDVKVAELFWDAFGRAPSSGEITTAVAHLTANAKQKRQAFEDILWALLNAKEFQFND